ncbi:hypothetical protein RBSWK_04901 [Rhodopirellula baltica SWK14]|uniref:Uncharacterized protein n=1 Tax=Rhodopirellula baltica SWK14 TaxID=993516 RepID=L7CAW9_RHOBT|nr:hypothetical protein RBSWK_04901 [Rhodopirellula baltica SWK14]
MPASGSPAEFAGLNRSPSSEISLAENAGSERLIGLLASDLNAFRVVERSAVTPQRDGL